jgi:hypothetical protein
MISTSAEEILLAENAVRAKGRGQTISTKVEAHPVTLAEFNNKGLAKHVKAVMDSVTGKGIPMGVHPSGNLPLVNAVELIFEVNLKLAKKMGIKDYRCRQKVQSQELWERELKEGKEAPWRQTASDGEGPDDPAHDLQAIKAPIIAYYDAPGFYGGVKDTQLKGPRQTLTSKAAVQVFLRQNFVGWIDGLIGSRGHQRWERISNEIKWHSNQSLARDILITHSWVKADGTEIELGHTEGQPN